MKIIVTPFLSIFAMGLLLLPIHADNQPTAFEKALYARARFQILSKVSDEDLVSYCVSMNVGGETLLRLHDEILEKQVQLTYLQIVQGLSNDNPQVQTLTTGLKNLHSQYTVKIGEVRRALEIEAQIAEATMGSLPQGPR